MGVIVQAGPGGDIDETPAPLAIGLVVVQNDAAHVCDHQVVPAVVVEIADRAAQSKTGPGQTDFLRYVRERAVPVVAV